MSFKDYSWNATILLAGNGTFYHYSSPKTISIQMLLVTVLFLALVSGNGTIIILTKRVKSLRTLPNMLLTNMAIVDILNVLFNLPNFVLVGLLEMHDIARGRRMSFLIATAQILFINLRLVNILTIAAVRFLAVSLGIRYNALKRKKYIVIGMLVPWVSGITIAIPWSQALSTIDIGPVPTYKYQITYYNQVGKIASFIVLFSAGVALAVLSFATLYKFKKQLKKFNRQLKNDDDLSNKQSARMNIARTRAESRVAVTITLTIVVYVVTYLPTILYAFLAGAPNEITKSASTKWFGFVANYFLYVSSACNPLIFIFRSAKLRGAVSNMLKT